jgi:cell division protein FtsX
MALTIVLSAFGGAVIGWAAFTGFYIYIKRALDHHPLGWNALKQPVSAGFWRSSGLFALVGAVIAATIAARSVR